MGDGVQAEAETLDQLRSLVAAQLRMEALCPVRSGHRALTTRIADLKAVVAPLARQEAADTLAPDPTGREAKIRAVLRASGIIDKLSEQVLGQPGLNAANVPPVPEQQDPAEQIQKDTTTALFGAPLKDGIRPKRGHRYLKVTVIRGRAFVEQPDMQEDPSCSLTVHLLLGDQRFRSTPAMGNVEPQFGFECMFELQTKDLSLLAEAARPLHTVVVRTDVAHHRSVVGTAFVDWRKALYLGTSSAAAELKDVSNPQMATGMLEMRLELFPAQLYLLSRDEVEYRIQHESKREMEASRLFFIYAKQWWGDFLQIRTSHADRLVKLFAYNELGKKLPVTSFMVPLRTRWLETPRHAARFVSLLVYEKARAVGDVGKMEIWRSAHTMLVAGRGFSMDAYVTLGTDKNNLAHAWVTTIDATGKVSFWETLTGIEYPQTGKHHFRTVGCCFTGDAFYANIQASDAADRTEFVLQDQAKWKSLSSDGIASMRQ
nr:Centrosomal protein of 76 kDa [Polyrhizophydium stewartii]